MNAKLFRENAETRDSDIYFSHVGPGHERAYFSLIALAGYAAKNHAGAPYAKPIPPFHIYSMGGEKPETVYRSLGAAKSAVRRWIKFWLVAAPDEVEWKAEDTGVHFTATANGIDIGSYYFCPEATARYHKGFRVYFGGTYYVTEFDSPEQARQAVQKTYVRWLNHAKSALLKSAKMSGDEVTRSPLRNRPNPLESTADKPGEPLSTHA